jgi:hypothetical protein
LVPIGAYEFFPQHVRLVANERHRQSHPYSQQKLGRRNQSGVSTEFFLSFTPRSFPTGIRDGGRRELREPRPCSLGRRNDCRDLAAVGIQRQVQESPARGSSVGVLVVVDHPLCQDSAQMLLAQRNHEVQTLTAYAPTNRSQ